MITYEACDDHLVELIRTHGTAMEQCMRHDANDTGASSRGARKLVCRVEEELQYARPQTTAEALAALAFVQKEYLRDRVGESTGVADLAVLNLLEGVAELIQRRAR